MKTVVVTGSTAGIGLESAAQIAETGARLVLVGRNPTKLATAAARVSAAGADSVETVVGDFESLTSVRAAAGRVRELCPQIDVLINNAGTVYDKRTLTGDGFESTWQVNHLAGFLFTESLLDLLGEGSRIVTTASDGHYRGTMDFDDLDFANSKYGVMRAYGRSKLANVLYTRELADRLESAGVTATCLHPGAVATDIWSGAPALARPILSVAKRFMRSPADGGATITYLAIDPAVEGESGGYYADNKLKQPSDLALDAALGKRLVDVSREQAGLN